MFFLSSILWASQDSLHSPCGVWSYAPNSILCKPQATTSVEELRLRGNASLSSWGPFAAGILKSPLQALNCCAQLHLLISRIWGGGAGITQSVPGSLAPQWCVANANSPHPPHFLPALNSSFRRILMGVGLSLTMPEAGHGTQFTPAKTCSK